VLVPVSKLDVGKPPLRFVSDEIVRGGSPVLAAAGGEVSDVVGIVVAALLVAAESEG